MLITERMVITEEILSSIALSLSEYEMIVSTIDRDPNPVELGMFGALWSEHCGYKHSKLLLSTLPSRSHRTLSESGSENAGAIDIGDGLAIVFKVESHNHPSAVEPFQGAATGVGGIVRDILAMGARPIALLNSLRFGRPEDPKTRHLFKGVVGGISWYGNCIGVPDVGGEIIFDSSYNQNPLVNAMCVGLVETSKIATAAANSAGHLVLLAGAETGRDGIHGASGLASRSLEDNQELLPTVQVGNPFLEKVLIEACLESLDHGLVPAIQDLGAAGLTSAALESADRGNRGVTLDVSKVHRREPGMTAYEVMLSESQERMLLMVSEEHIGQLSNIFAKWGIPLVEIGYITEDAVARVVDGDQLLVNLPLKVLTESPKYRLKGEMTQEQIDRQKLNLSNLTLPKCGPDQVLLQLLASPNIASKHSVYRQYDHQVQTNTVVGPGSDAALLRIKGTHKSIALTIDGNGRYCYLDPYRGGEIAIAEACRNLSCTGATPLALTDCLNFGNPEKPDVYYQLEWTIRGMARACRVLGVPVVSGNVSLYNEYQDQPIFPTPIIGGLGLLDDATKYVSAPFPEEELLVMLLGADGWSHQPYGLAGSEYLEICHNLVIGRPYIKLDLEKKVQALCREAITRGLVRSAHDCSEGGLATSLAECCILGVSPRTSSTSNQKLRSIGFRSSEGVASLPLRWDVPLFGEHQSRIVVSLTPGNRTALVNLADAIGVPIMELGLTGGTRFKIGSAIDLPIDDIYETWSGGLENALLG